MSQGRPTNGSPPVPGTRRTDLANFFGREGRASRCTPRQAVDDVLGKLPADRMAILELIDIGRTVFAHWLPGVQLKFHAKPLLAWTDAPLALRDDLPQFSVVKGRLCRTGVDTSLDP